MFYWTPTKNAAGDKCIVCGKMFTHGYTTILGDFYCTKDRRLKEINDLSLARISLWKREDTPEILLSEIIHELVDHVNMKNVKWLMLFPQESLEDAKELSENFQVIGNVPTSKGWIYLLGTKQST